MEGWRIIRKNGRGMVWKDGGSLERMEEGWDGGWRIIRKNGRGMGWKDG